jgi:prophage regulatory protein
MQLHARHDMDSAAAPRKLIRKRQLLEQVPYSESYIWRLEKAGEFPVRVQLGPNAVAWYQDEVDAWKAKLIRGAGRPVRRQLTEPATTDTEQGAGQ